MNAQDFAIVIGIAHYPYLRPLEGPVLDAERVCEWLVGPAGVPEDTNLELVVSKNSAAEHPFLDEIDAAFDRIFERAASGARRLYIYFAGHGCSKAIDHLALLMANANPDRLNRAMNATEYRQSLATLLFPEQVYFFDCCRNYDARISGRGPEWTVNPGAAPVPDLTQVVLYAAGFTQYANERHLLYSERRGLFTEALLEGLNGGAATFDAASDSWVVCSDRLISFVYERLKELTSGEQVEQDLWTDPKGVPRHLVLSTGVEPRLLQVTVKAPARTSQITVLDKDVQQIESRPVLDSRDTITVELPPGQYVIRAEPGGQGEIINLVDRPLHVDLED
jgi:uncharacterized caspase-like protein